MQKSRADREESDSHMSLPKLVQILSYLLVLVGGVIIGMVMTSHMNQHFTSQKYITTNRIYGFADSNCKIVEDCVLENCLSMETFLQPKNLTHSMSDNELFWRASMVPRMENYYPYKRVPKVAFLFLTRGPLPLLRLWERFFKSHEMYYSIYIHALPGFELNVSESSAFYGRQIPSQHVEWGSAGLVDAEKRLLANALLDFSNERFVLLSESCIPVYNFPTVYKYLTGSNQCFIESYDDPSRYGRGRYSRSMLPHIKLQDWRKGSQWFEMNRLVATYAVSETKYFSLFRRYCKPACYPDEHYFPTYLKMFHGSLNGNRSVTWVDWSQGGPHPTTFGEKDITEDFIQSIRNNGTQCSYNSEVTSVCYLFARKFAPDALESLLNLTLKVMEF